MATWLSQFFDNEFEIASDVRNEYLDYLRVGLTGPAATRRLKKDFAEAFADADVHEPVFWMALAVTQWQYGRLEPRVKSRAMAVIDKGGDVAAYPGRRQARRRAVLAAVRRRLESPQPREKPIKVTAPARPLKQIPREWKTGQVVAYRRDSGRYVLLLTEGVIRHDYSGQLPYFVVLHWSGAKIPDPEKIRLLRKGRRLIGVYPIRKGDRIPWDRVQRLNVFLEPTGVASFDRDGVFCEDGFDGCEWAELDSEL